MQDAVFPLLDFAVIVAVPALTAVTLPFDTVATLLLEVLHVTVLLAALEGVIVALIVSLVPFIKVSDVLESFTLDTGVVTVTLQDAVLPLFVFAVMVAVPGPIAVTLPFDTVATLLLLVVQVIVLFVAFDGLIVAVRVAVLFFSSVSLVLFSVTPVSETYAYGVPGSAVPS